MRLLEADDTGGVTLTQDFLDEDIPRPYAILSHTWGDKEVTLQDLGAEDVKERPEYTKIRFCTEQARRDGIRYFWIDSCCIDKTNSVELSRAINSMFRWYASAKVCFVYLADVRSKRADADDDWQDDFRKSRWFTRGWTLQELLAPQDVQFFSRYGDKLGDKTSLETHIRDITGIPARALQGSLLSSFTRQERFAWQQGRHTKVSEDMTYSLLGIFDVSLPVIYGEGRDQARRRLEREIDIATKGTHHEDFSVPFSLVDAVETAHFVSRERELEDMSRLLAGDGVRHMVVLQGLGGIGKTQLAIAYAMRHRDRYSAIFWINTKDEASAEQSFGTIIRQITRVHPSAHEFRTEGKIDKIADSVSPVKDWLSRAGNNRWLMIFDNHDNPQVPGNTDADAVDHRKYFPEAHQGSIIITTRSSEVYPEYSIQVQKLKEIQVGLDILTNASARANLSNDHHAVQLAKHLDGLPLALATAGAYLRQSSLSIADYLRLYESSWAKLQKTSPTLRTYEDRTLYSTWQLSFDQIEQRSHIAANLLRLWAYFDNNDLWYELLDHAVNDDPDWFHELAEDELEFHNAMRILCDHGIVEANPTTEEVIESAGYSIHTCVHSWTKTVLGPGPCEGLARLALECIATHIPDRYALNEDAIQRRMLNHASRMTLIECSADGVSWAFHNIACLFIDQNRFDEAQKLCLRALTGNDSLSEPEKSEQISITLNSLAIVYRLQRRLHDALSTLDRALKIAEVIYGKCHHEIAFAICNLGLVYKDQGKLEEAEVMYQRALQIREAALGEHHLLTLRSVSMLADLYEDQERFDEAVVLYQRDLQGRQDALGICHMETLEAARCLGRTYKQQGRLQEAEIMHLRVLNGLESASVQDKKSIGAALFSLGNVNSDLGRVDKAVLLYERALVIKEAILGGKDTSTLGCLHNLGHAYEEVERFNEAEEVFQRAWSGYRAIFGPDHVETLKAALRLCSVHCRQGKVDKAVDLYQTLICGTKLIAWNHARLLHAAYNLGLNFLFSDRINEAGEMFRRALNGCQNIYGSNHVQTLDAAFLLCDVLCRQGKVEEAVALYKTFAGGIEAFAWSAGDFSNRERLAISTLKLGCRFGDSLRFDEAECLLRRALDGCPDIFGPDHVDTLNANTGLGLALVKLGKYDEAEQAYQRSLQHYDRMSTECKDVVDQLGRYVDEACPNPSNATSQESDVCSPEHSAPSTLSQDKTPMGRKFKVNALGIRLRTGTTNVGTSIKTDEGHALARFSSPENAAKKLLEKAGRTR